MIGRSSASSASISARASSSVAAFAVIRTYRPSIPRARNAIVGFPWTSTRSAIISASRDSDVPHVFSERDTMTARSPERSRRSGSTWSVTICCISYGTPGTA